MQVIGNIIYAEKVTVGGTAVDTTPIMGGTVLIVGKVAFHFAVVGDATVNENYWPANSPLYVKVGNGGKVSLLSAGAAGDVYASLIHGA